MQRSILTLPDFSKAYNTVWREKLLLHILDTGIPSTFIRWIRSFFNDPRALFQLFNVFSSNWCFTQGLPKDSILARLLFLLFIYNLASIRRRWSYSSLPWWHLNPHYSTQERRCWSCCPVSSKLCIDLKPGMEIKFEHWKKWGISLFHLVQQKYFATCYLHWNSENSHQHHSSSSRCHSGQKPYIERTTEGTNYVVIIQYSYHQSHSTHFLGLPSFHSRDSFSRTNLQQAWLCSSCMAALALRY